MKIVKNLTYIALIALTLGFCSQAPAIPERNVIELIDNGSSENIFDKPYYDKSDNKPGGSPFGRLLSVVLQKEKPNYCVRASGVITHRWIAKEEKEKPKLEKALQKKETEEKEVQQTKDKLKQEQQEVIILQQLIKATENYLSDESASNKEILEKLIQNLPKKMKQQYENFTKTILFFFSAHNNKNKLLQNFENNSSYIEIKTLILENYSQSKKSIVQHVEQSLKVNLITLKVNIDILKRNLKTLAKNIKTLDEQIAALKIFVVGDAIKNWRYFHFLKCDTYLFVPKTTNISMLKIKEGFALTNLKLCKEILSFEKLKTSVKKWEDWSFVKKNKEKYAKWKELQEAYVPKSQDWVFYHGGHGLFAPQVSRNTKELNLLGIVIKHIKKLYAQSACISGLCINDALDRLTFLGTTIKTIATIERCCFGGGQQALTVSNHLRNLEQHNDDFTSFTYGIQTLTDTASFGNSDLTIDFNVFFENIRKAHAISVQENAETAKLSHITQGLKSVIVNEKNDPRFIPNIRLPYAQSFLELPAAALPDTLGIKKTTYENQDLTIDPEKDVATLLRHVNIGNISIKSTDKNKKTIFVSKGEALGNATHKIKSLTSTTYDLEKIVRSFFELKETSKKAFIINETKTRMLNDPKNNERFEVVIFKSFEHNEESNTKVLGDVYLREKEFERYYHIAIDDSFEDEGSNYKLCYKSKNKKQNVNANKETKKKRTLTIGKRKRILKKEYFKQLQKAENYFERQMEKAKNL